MRSIRLGVCQIDTRGASGRRAGASTISCATDPGARATRGPSKFFLSLEDDLMRIFGSEWMDSMLMRLGLKDAAAVAGREEGGRAGW